MQFIPRGIRFDKTGKAVSVGCGVYHTEGLLKVINLPTDHYDFIGPVNVIGKTEEEINSEATQYKHN